MAEIELGVLDRQCLDRRIGASEILEQETQAWQDQRNRDAIRVDWRFTTQDARILKSLADGLLAAHALQKQHPMTQRRAAWYDKPAPTFVDAIALVRRHLWLTSEGFSTSVVDPRLCAIRRRKQGCRASCGIFRAGLLSIQGWAQTWKNLPAAPRCVV